MSDHIPDATKMIGETPRTDEQINGKPCTRFAILAGDSLRDALVPSEFCRQLERELNAANERIRLLIAERDTARRQADQNYKLREEFCELLGTDDVEQGVAMVRGLQERIKRLEEMYEGEIGENEQFLGSNLQGLLTRELNWSKEHIKRLEEELERTKEDRNAIAKNTREPLLLKLDHANERISKLNDYVAALETAGDLMANELSYGYDVDMWNKAKEAKL